VLRRIALPLDVLAQLVVLSGCIPKDLSNTYESELTQLVASYWSFER
jgi:hypothetical protein